MPISLFGSLSEPFRPAQTVPFTSLHAGPDAVFPPGLNIASHREPVQTVPALADGPFHSNSTPGQTRFSPQD